MRFGNHALLFDVVKLPLDLVIVRQLDRLLHRKHLKLVVSCKLVGVHVFIKFMNVELDGVLKVAALLLLLFRWR